MRDPVSNYVPDQLWQGVARPPCVIKLKSLKHRRDEFRSDLAVRPKDSISFPWGLAFLFHGHLFLTAGTARSLHYTWLNAFHPKDAHPVILVLAYRLVYPNR
jgi:hypothetical protein